MDNVYKPLVDLNDRLAESAFVLQITDPTSKYYGGVIDPVTGIPMPSHVGVASWIGIWAAAICNPDSRYYKDPELLTRLSQAADFMLNRQHADGTISLGSTNFNSPPDTGFAVNGMAEIYMLFQKQLWTEIEPLTSKIKLFLERSIPAMLTGGCHTPNHRWVLTSALALLHEIFPRPELLERAEQWLAEGIDITADGEWTERSNGI